MFNIKNLGAVRQYVSQTRQPYVYILFVIVIDRFQIFLRKYIITQIKLDNKITQFFVHIPFSFYFL